jgi:cellulose synthase/poly-beta-1,6-N-acetylglucosamine synthase-like glycosyltransferase
MNILTLILHLAEFILFIYFGVASLYVFIFALAGLFPYRQKRNHQGRKRNIAVLIPAYKEDAVIVDVAEDALLHDYPQDRYDVIVIADSLERETISKLKSLPVKIIEVSFISSTKAKALNRTMSVLDPGYDIAVVLDADNLMENTFLTKINDAFNNGFIVVQGHRTAKNTDTPFALLDAVSEEINNHIFRKGHRNMGLSSALIGSGMAFDYTFFKETMAGVKAVGGFDKELELIVLKEKIKIEYLHDALIMDEKISQAPAFARQRKRWLSAQFVYFRRYFLQGLYHLLFKGNIDFFDKVYQMISPPRVLLTGIVTVMTACYGLAGLIAEGKWLYFSAGDWSLIFIMIITALLFSIPRKFYKRRTIFALRSLPRVFWVMLLSLFKLKGANKKFIHTRHGTTDPKK